MSLTEAIRLNIYPSPPYCSFLVLTQEPKNASYLLSFRTSFLHLRVYPLVEVTRHDSGHHTLGAQPNVHNKISHFLIQSCHKIQALVCLLNDDLMVRITQNALFVYFLFGLNFGDHQSFSFSLSHSLTTSLSRMHSRDLRFNPIVNYKVTKVKTMNLKLWET